MKKPRKKVRFNYEPPPEPPKPPLIDVVDGLRTKLRQVEQTNMQFAREKARRTDQFKALLQVANLLLVVASNEIVRRDD